MTAWVITALILISMVLLAGCAGLMWRVRELQADLDLATRNLIKILERSANVRPLLRNVNGRGDARRLPPGQPR